MVNHATLLFAAAALAACHYQRTSSSTDTSTEATATVHAPDLKVTRTSDREIIVQRSFRAPRAQLFAALTTPDKLQRWLSAGGRKLAQCEVDLRAGGAYRYVFKTRSGAEFVMYGTFREVVRDERFVHTEQYSGLDWPPLVTTTTLTEQAGRTTLTLHILYPSKQICDLDAPNQGGDEVFAQLDLLLAESGAG